MKEPEHQFLQGQLEHFYQGHFLEDPPEAEKREFGVGEPGKKIVSRHLAFSSQDEFNQFLRQALPFYVSYSVGYYRFPSRSPMEKKEPLGADLVYEFDADDIPTTCKEKHDLWTCPQCRKEGVGSSPGLVCPDCQIPVKVENWFCSDCIQETKKQTLALLEILENEFALTETALNFSGNAGFHVHLRSPAIRGLSASARTELLDYLSLHGVEFEQLGFLEDGKLWRCPQKKGAIGLARKLLGELARMVSTEDPSTLAALGGVPTSKVKNFLAKKEEVLLALDQGALYALEGKKEFTKTFWFHLLDQAKENLSLAVDRQTSLDIKKIVRVPGSLHGGTFFEAKKVEREELPSFDPFREALAVGGDPIKVFIYKAPRFSLGGQSFGPFENRIESLPLFAACYLLAREKAVLYSGAKGTHHGLQ